MEHLQSFLESHMAAVFPLWQQGKLASYIPALEQADPQAFGAVILGVDGSVAKHGQWDVPFTIQSISKVISFLCCLMDAPPQQVFSKISVESSPSSFNAIAELETHASKKPLNPMINTGAIAVMELIAGKSAGEKFQRITEMVCLLTGKKAVSYNKEVYASEQESGDRNRSLAYYMKSIGVIGGEVEPLLETYFRACALELSSEDLAKIALVFAQDGSDGTRQLVPRQAVRLCRTVMAMCGMYNESGRYATQVGLPSKSGVGGGILAVAPRRMGIGIFAPALNPYGSSVCGVALMEALSHGLDLSIF